MRLILLSILSILYLALFIKRKIIDRYLIINENKKAITNIEYYRDIINDYSPLIYAKLANIDIKNSDVITSMLLYLEEKNVMDIDENNNIIIKDTSNLKEHEMFFVSKMKFIFSDLREKQNTKYNNNYTLLQQLDLLIYQDMIKENLIDINNESGYFTNRISRTNFYNLVDVLPLIYNIFCIFLLPAENNLFSFISIIIYWISILISILIYIISIKNNNRLEVLKTNIGHEHTQKLIAQKKFLKNYTMISQKEIGDKILWESYIRNAILLDLKGKLDKESIKFYEDILNKYHYLERNDDEKFLSFITYILVLSPWIFLLIVSKNIFFVTMLSAFLTSLPFMFLAKRD